MDRIFIDSKVRDIDSNSGAKIIDEIVFAQHILSNIESSSSSRLSIH